MAVGLKLEFALSRLASRTKRKERPSKGPSEARSFKTKTVVRVRVSLLCRVEELIAKKQYTATQETCGGAGNGKRAAADEADETDEMGREGSQKTSSTGNLDNTNRTAHRPLP